MEKETELSSTTTSSSTTADNTSNSNSNSNSSSSNEMEKRYKGVRKRKWGKWVSEIRLPNSRERIWLGSYNSPEKAARAFDAAMFCLRGRKAAPRFNFPHAIPDIRRDGPMTAAEIQLAASNFANQLDHSSSSTSTESDPWGWETMDWSFLDTPTSSTTLAGFAAPAMDDLLYDQLCLPSPEEEEELCYDCYAHSSLLWNF